MKKVLSLALAAAMTVSLAACGSGDGQTQAGTDAAAGSQTNAQTEAADGSAAGESQAGSEAALTGSGVAKEDLKIGIIYIGDENEGYSAAHMAGIDEMVEALGLDESQVIEKTLIGETEACYDAACDLADQDRKSVV